MYNVKKLLQNALALSLDNLIMVLHEMNEGLIWFVSKVGDDKVIMNLHPITLLNTSYKILAKALALRLRTLLTMMITPKQTSFIRGQYILDKC